MRNIALITLAVLSTLSALPASAQTKDEARYLALLDRPASGLVDLISVRGDDLDPTITVSTRGLTAFVSKGLLESTTTENSWLRGFIDKKTGVVSAQIYQTITYGGRGFQDFTRATYEAPSGVEEASVSQVGSDVECGRYGCTHYADVVFTVPMSVLREAAKAYSPQNSRVALKYRIFGQGGTNIDDAMPANEIAAFVQVLDEEAAKLKK